MKTELKKRILAYIKNPHMGHEEAKAIVAELENELYYADCDTHSVSIDDLNSLPVKTQATLRTKLGKNDVEKYTIEDCQKVADAIAELICDEFSENIANAIEYEL